MFQIRKVIIRNLDPGVPRFFLVISSRFPWFSLSKTLRNPDPEPILVFSYQMHRVYVKKKSNPTSNAYLNVSEHLTRSNVNSRQVCCKTVISDIVFFLVCSRFLEVLEMSGKLIGQLFFVLRNFINSGVITWR